MKKKLLSVLMAAVMVAGVGGVGAAQVKADDEKILGAGIYSASDNFNSYIGKAITNACDGIFKTNIEDGQNDQSTQNNQVDTMLAKGASAVAVSVCDVTAAPTLIQKCKDAGNVPIIFFNKEIHRRLRRQQLHPFHIRYRLYWKHFRYVLLPGLLQMHTSYLQLRKP